MRSDGVEAWGLFYKIHAFVLFRLIRSLLIALNQRLERVGVSVRESWFNKFIGLCVHVCS